MVNYYEVLEVSEKASKEVIEKAYKALAKKYHPDLNHENKKEAEAKMKEINEAFDILMDENKRATFDRVLERKRQIEQRKQSYSNQSSSYQNPTSKNAQKSNSTSSNPDKTFVDHNKISYSNGYYTDHDDNFFINTNHMDKKTQKKLQNKIQERYLEAYDAYLRERGYKLKYRWTFKKIMQLILAIIITILILTLLFFIPPIHDWCIELYEEDFAIKIIVDIIASIFKSIGQIFT